MLRATVEHKFGSLGARDLDPVFAIAERVHRDERRRSGEPYITHPITVAQYVADWGLPLICIQAALAHDIPQSGQLDACAEQLGQELSACIREVHALGTPLAVHEPGERVSVIGMDRRQLRTILLAGVLIGIGVGTVVLQLIHNRRLLVIALGAVFIIGGVIVGSRHVLTQATGRAPDDVPASGPSLPGVARTRARRS